MSELKKHSGGCHCKAVRFEVEMELDQGLACNCSMCGKAGTILKFVPAEQFTLLSGEDDLSDYQFNKKVIHHLFCKHCGIKAFGKGKGPDGTEMVAVNVRCLDDVDLGAIETTHFDGKNY